MSKSNRHRFCLRLAIALAPGLAVAGSAVANQILVPSQQPTIQAGINAAVNGDEVILADGTYTGAGNVNCTFGGKLITVRSASGNPEACIIDCQGVANTNAFTFNTGETTAAVLRGITITRATGQSALASRGRAIVMIGASPTIENCRFIDNSSSLPGAIGCTSGSTAVITDCFFQGNGGSASSGAVDLFLPSTQPVLTRCTFIDNTANSFGGAVAIQAAATATFHRCRFIHNTAGADGGAVNVGGTLIAVNCLFDNNISGNDGGAIHVSSAPSQAQLTNCTLNANVANDEFPGIESGGGAVWVQDGGTATFQNSIVYNNFPNGAESSTEQPGTINSTFSNVEDGPLGIGSFDMPPLFTSPNGFDTIPGTLDDDFTLRADSVGIDSGSNALVPAGVVVDIDGNPRFVDDPDSLDIGSGRPPLVDMGCYEFQPKSLCPADLNGSGNVNGLDLAILLGAWGLCP